MQFHVFRPAAFSRKRISLLAAGMVMSGACALIFLLLFVEPDFFPAATALVGGSALVFLIFLFFYLLTLRQYSLRYFFLGKEYRRQLEEILPHFTAFDGARKKQLLKDCKPSYWVFGQVLQSGDYVNKSLYRDPKETGITLRMVRELLSSCDRKDGWRGFIGVCDSGDFYYQRQNYEGILVNDPLDGYEIRSVLSSFLFSHSFRYLVEWISDACDFTLRDTGISEKYTAELETVKADMDAVFSPVLFTFREELEKIEALLSHSAAEQNPPAGNQT